MATISLFTPIRYTENKSYGEQALSLLCKYFYLGGVRATVVDANNQVSLKRDTLSWNTIAWKVVSYVAFFPITFCLLAAYTVLRSRYHFTVMNASQNSSVIPKQSPKKDLTPSFLTKNEHSSPVLLEQRPEQHSPLPSVPAMTFFSDAPSKTDSVIVPPPSIQTDSAVSLELSKEPIAIATTSVQDMAVQDTVTKIEQVVHTEFSMLPKEKPVAPSTDLWSQFKDVQQIEDGYGEYVITLKSGEEISEKVFKKAYRQIDSVPKNTPNRIDAIRQVIDPSLQVTFIPRTLYELIFIKAAIEEDMNEQSVCPLQRKELFEEFEKYCTDSSADKESFFYTDTFTERRPHCWHICRFHTQSPGDYTHSRVQEVAFRLNALIVSQLKPAGPLEADRMIASAEEHITYLRNHAKKFNIHDMGAWCGVRGMSINFGSKKELSGRVQALPMGVREEAHAQLLRNAIQLECSQQAKNSYILYRGGNFKKDFSLSASSVEGTSLSYGTSLFAGSVWDETTSPNYYCVAQKRDVYAIVIPKTEQSPFFIPHTNTICQLFSEGEFFHARSLLPKGTESTRISGVFGTAKEEHVKQITSQDDDADALAKKINSYKKHAELLYKSVQYNFTF